MIKYCHFAGVAKHHGLKKFNLYMGTIGLKTHDLIIHFHGIDRQSYKIKSNKILRIQFGGKSNFRFCLDGLS